ncbi:MAG: glutaminyl-peptide cyclotransferase [Bryobacteraceae bacterium]|nr:glutaminyl-peptide cyclotransferase [Bryobacteraceae bacterium]
MLTVAAMAESPVARYRVVKAYPHDPGAFTQGLIYLDGFLYESTGLNGRSSLRMTELATGKVLQRQPVPAQYFAEGMTNFGGQLFQLTWQSGKAFVYDRFSFKLLREHTYTGEGWGLTNDGKRLILSDGTAQIRFIDPKTFAVTGKLNVTDQGKPVDRLNELEYVKGEILANVWQTELIARISPVSGKVLGWIDLSGLLTPSEAQGVDVLNGIAYDAKQDRLFVTGKLWPKLFEIKVGK